MKYTRSPIQHGLVRLPSSRTNRSNSPVPLRSIHRLPTRPPRYRFHRAGSVSVHRPRTTAPVGLYAIEAAGPSGSRVGSPPAGETVNSQRSRNGRPASVAYAIRPSGVNPATRVRPAWYVNRRASPPPAGITYTSAGPSSRPANASSEPSGEIRGVPASATPAVNRYARPPEEPTSHRSSSQTNTMSSPWIAGVRTYMRPTLSGRGRIRGRAAAGSRVPGGVDEGQALGSRSMWYGSP